MVPIFTFFIECNGVYNITIALIVFILAAFTDLIDGKIARKHKDITLLGIFLDPLADKLLISTALIYFLTMSSLCIPVWMIVMIISRDFLITGLRYTLANKNIIIPANKLGKLKTASQVFGIIVIMLILIINKLIIKVNNMMPIIFVLYNRYLLCSVVLIKLPLYIIIIIILFTMLSGITYVWKYREFFHEK
jgi:CDP-diacylglycerol--glycerol-3-phosphate 3-phosphatidyltransferase